ncbi:chromosome partition protein MukE [Candidatus Williamhamiltonella defendens]|uniref:chromosome partition protein MukE n=1 Tax=Candidatus Williamhamiltonella defendens TaxID=138072 RepID=UPI00387EA475
MASLVMQEPYKELITLSDKNCSNLDKQKLQERVSTSLNHLRWLALVRKIFQNNKHVHLFGLTGFSGELS